MLPIGQAIPFTERRLSEQSQITEADIAMAISLWKKYAPTQYRALITGGGALFGWDPNRRQFFYESNGYMIDPLRLRNVAIEPFLQNVRVAMRDISTRLQNKQISLPEWQTEMMALTKSSQVAAALVANGGADNQDESNALLVAAGIAAMLAFLQTFAQEIQTGKQLLNGLLLSRTDLYALGGRDAYEEARRNGFIFSGMATQERRVLQPGANHCVSNDEQEGCIELAALGWQPIGTLPRLYDTPCRTNCLCTFIFR